MKRGERAQRRGCRKTSVFLSRETGISGNFVGRIKGALAVAVRGREQHHLGARERVRRGRRGAAPGVADLPRPGAVLHHLRRARAVQAAAGAAAPVRGRPRVSLADLDVARRRLYRRRKLTNAVALALALAAMAFGVFWLIWILWETVRLGVGGLSLATLTQMTPPPQADDGGLANAIIGALAMAALATLIGTPIGILAGIYLAEYGRTNLLGRTTQFVSDILLSAPSIVIGLFIYEVVVARTRTFSGFAGALALALIVIPVVIRTTENMLSLIPNGIGR